jgi:hypothetical protein
MMNRLAQLCALLAALVAAAPASAQGTLYGLSNGFGIEANNRIYQVNPANGDLTNIVQVTLPGLSVTRSLGMAAQPGTGTLYAIIQTDADSTTNRRLVTIDPTTGVATNVGNMGNAFASMAFRADGTLWAVTGENGATPETLFTISTVNGSATQQFALGNGADGETISFHANGLLYHSTGNTTALFESVNVDTQAVTPIGQATTEMFAMGYLPTTGQLLGSDIDSQLFSIDIATGARTPIGSMSDQIPGADNRALAFVAAVPEPTTVGLLAGGAVAALGFRYGKRRFNRRQD